MGLIARPHCLGHVMLGDRFRYWQGASGRRYLFTEIAPRDIPDYRGAVGLEIEEDGLIDARSRVVCLVEIDEAGAVERHPVGASTPARAAFVHLLADSATSRRTILLDLMAGL